MNLSAADRRRLFLSAFTAMVTLATTFAVRADILADLGERFHLTHARLGLIGTAISGGYLVSILIGGRLCDVVGMGPLLRLACVGHILGIALTALAPESSFGLLLAATLLVGLADGVAEAVMNPLAAALYPKDRTGRISMLHAGWPAGLLLGGMLCLALTALVDPAWSWRIKMAMALGPACLYGWLAWGRPFPRAAAVSNPGRWTDAFHPVFLLLLGCMVFTAVSEMGPDQWIGSVMRDTVGVRGVAFLMYTAVIMFVLRLRGGALARRFTPFGLLAGSCVLAAVGLFWASGTSSAWTALAAITLFGVGKTCLWPTLLGVTSERFRRSGPFLLAVMSAVGMVAGGLASPVLGRIYDRAGAAAVFRFAALLPLPPLLVFVTLGLLAARVRRRVG